MHPRRPFALLLALGLPRTRRMRRRRRRSRRAPMRWPRPAGRPPPAIRAGIHDVSYVEDGVHPWTEAALEDAAPVRIDTTDGFPIERIASLRPDVILATNTYPLASHSWRELKAIAPVVAHTGTAGADPWEDGLRAIAEALGRVSYAVAELVPRLGSAMGR